MTPSDNPASTGGNPAVIQWQNAPIHRTERELHILGKYALAFKLDQILNAVPTLLVQKSKFVLL